MKPLLNNYHIIFLCMIGLTSIILTTMIAGAAKASQSPSFAIWYGNNPPMDLLSQFDRIIVEADNLQDKEIDALKQHGGKVLAYLSVGEWNPQRRSKTAISPDWVIGNNLNWNSNIMNLSAPGWRRFLINRAKELKKRGFDGLFLDTLDSYLLPGIRMEQRENLQNGLVQLIMQIKALHPDFLLVANRGFEVMDRVAPYLEAVAAESLYQGWNNTKQQYLSVNEEDRLWLKNILHKIKSKHNLDILVIDYLPPERRESARRTARKIEHEGFIPWVANPSFTYMGIGSIEAIPRKILCIYDSRTESRNISEIAVHRWCAPILEHMGFIPVYIDLQKGLPVEILQGRYAGIVTWLNAPVNYSTFPRWLQEKIKEKSPLAVLGDVSVLKDPQLADLIGLKIGKKPKASQLSATQKSPLIGFQGHSLKRVDHLEPIVSKPKHRNSAHWRFADDDGESADAVVIGDWGGFAAEPALPNSDGNRLTPWIVDPFAFLQQALKLPSMPVPDVTTENGRRLFFIHVDGDGFTQKFEMPNKGYASEILLEEIFKSYPVPHTVSIIEGEIASNSLKPEISKKLEGIAKRIFALNHVELAGHSYSRPVDWTFNSGEKNAQNDALPLKGYTPRLDREIIGSVNYIDSTLAPPNKKTVVFLWTGNARPTPEAVNMVSQKGLLNMNGGETVVSTPLYTISGISGMGIPFGNGEFQTYTPIGSENDFTGNWTRDFSNYRRVIEIFQKTDHPKRMKPISIYYHFYSGSKIESLAALKEVYDWALRQETMPIAASDYILKVLNYPQIGISRRTNGVFRVTGLSELKTLRLNQTAGWPQKGNSLGIAGWREFSENIYLHVGMESTIDILLGPKPTPFLHLYQANGRLAKWQVESDNKINFRIISNTPVLVEVAYTGADCNVRWKQGTILPEKRRKNVFSFNFPTNDTENAVLECHE